MTDCIRIDLNNFAAEIWTGKAKVDLTDENGPLFPAAFIEELIEVTSGSVVIGDAWDGSAFHAQASVINTRVEGMVFLSRVQDTEYSGVMAAAQSSVQIERWLDQIRILGYVDVASDVAITAKAALVAAELLTQDRANVIFANP